MTPAKRVARRKSAVPETPESGPGTALRVRFRSFGKLVERAGAGRPLLRGLRVAFDPDADRVVVVHGGVRVEMLLALHRDDTPPCGTIECRRIDAAGATEPALLARFRFDESGAIVDASLSELLGQKVDEEEGAWSIVAALIWDAMQQS